MCTVSLQLFSISISEFEFNFFAILFGFSTFECVTRAVTQLQSESHL